MKSIIWILGWLSAYVIVTVQAAQYKQILDKNWSFTIEGVTGKYPATIPSTLSEDLIYNNFVPSNPYYRDNFLKYYSFETKGANYSTSFTTPSQYAATQKQKLIFEGLDTHSRVLLNGQPILTTHNMFRRYEVAVNTSGSNNLTV